MEHVDFDLKKYCHSFLDQKDLGELTFYQDGNNRVYSYRELIESSLQVAGELVESDTPFYALQFSSPYSFFIHLLAGIFANKKLIIIAANEPTEAVLNYQKKLGFNSLLKDDHVSLKNRKINFMIPHIDPNQIIFSLLSSGSSAPSKDIALTLTNVYSSARGLIDYFGITKKDKTFLNLPHHHIGGLMIFWRAFFSQSTVTTIENEPFQFISLVPLQLKRFLNDPVKLQLLKNCRGVLIGGSTLDMDLKKKSIDQAIPIFETFGMSETTSLVLLNGKTIIKNQEVKLDSEGYFLIKGPNLSPSVITDSEGFYHTKDIGHKNTDGSLSFSHRADLLFKSAGELIDPLQVEKKVKELPWITEAIALSIPHPKWTHALTLLYQSSDPQKGETDIKAHLKNSLHPYLVPKYFFSAPDDLMGNGIKPKRFSLSQWAQLEYLKSLFHFKFIQSKSPANKLIVLLHGFMEDYSDMTSIMDSPKDDNHFLLIDLPGHGSTKASTFTSREEIFSGLKQLISFFQQDLCLIMYGYSMGGRVALELSLNSIKPDLLILESAHLGLETSIEKKERFKSDKLLFEDQVDLNIFFENWYKNPIFGNYNQSPQYQTEIQKKIKHSAHEWHKALEYFSPGISPYLLPEILKLIADQKIIGIVGSVDHKYKNHYQKMKTILHNFLYYEIEDAAHNPHKTHPNEIKKILKEFI